MPSAFCLVVVQALACFGLSTFEHETLFWLDFVVLVPTLLPLLYILLQVRRRRQLDRNSINNHHTSVRQVVPSALRVPVGAFAFAGICIVLAAGLNAASRLSNEADNLRPKRTMKLDRLVLHCVRENERQLTFYPCAEEQAHCQSCTHWASSLCSHLRRWHRQLPTPFAHPSLVSCQSWLSVKALRRQSLCLPAETIEKPASSNSPPAPT